MDILTTAGRKARSLREFVRGLTDTAHPLLVQIVPIRRCNIDCGYCNEYDKVSPPVATDVMRRRIDHLASLGTSVVAFSGGEPMLHPDLDDLIRHIRARGMMAGLITNGYFLVPKRIQDLNRAGLDFLQISIDNIEPDEVSKKSLRVLDKKLQHLKDHANSAEHHSDLGGGIKNPEDATINTRAREGFDLHRQQPRIGRPAARVDRTQGLRRCVGGPQRPLPAVRIPYSGITNFQNNLADGKPNEWRCAGRLPYVCEEGLVHYCSQQRGYWACRSSFTRPDPPGVRDAEVVRALLHGRLRPSRVDHGFLAVAATRGVTSPQSIVGGRLTRRSSS